MNKHIRKYNEINKSSFDFYQFIDLQYITTNKYNLEYAYSNNIKYYLYMENILYLLIYNIYKYIINYLFKRLIFPSSGHNHDEICKLQKSFLSRM